MGEFKRIHGPLTPLRAKNQHDLPKNLGCKLHLSINCKVNPPGIRKLTYSSISRSLEYVFKINVFQNQSLSVSVYNDIDQIKIIIITIIIQTSLTYLRS